MEATDGIGGGRWGAAGYQDKGPYNRTMHRPLCDNATNARSWELLSGLKFKYIWGKAHIHDYLRAPPRDRNQIGRAAS
ncbi:hypothetical protein MPLSOD_40557 [Mesorhizobium sp. SOD10]|nr:hypothetical protein MPLSOD_40557 [Mesorhizobium sp. SOD10]